jgi:hypothetical protein
MGGDFLHVALDISADGKLPFPPPKDAGNLQSFIHNITLFLTSTETGKNFTISNATTTTPPLADILTQEPGSTVKHVNFEWPDCLVGDGRNTKGTARGTYNISIHQSFRLNGSEYYTVMNLPISVTNKIEQFPGATQLQTNPRPGPLSANGGRMQCGALENKLLNLAELEASVNNPGKRPLTDGMGVGVSSGEIGNQGGDGQGQVGNQGGNGQGLIGNQDGDGQGLIGNSGNAVKCGLSLLLVSLMLVALAI